MSRPLALVLLAPLAALVLAACDTPDNLPLSSGPSASPASSAAPAVVVELQYDSIEPARVTIRVGQTVQWQWMEAPEAANVVFTGFSSPTMVNGTWSHTFSEAGTYSYRDSLSPIATGVITVRR
ncbi:MAG TPA: hypothetical protein VK386_03645 [Acidimicrobiales bacterium]|nr:hypothetical protein [Acidimicrobiales bacterium]